MHKALGLAIAIALITAAPAAAQKVIIDYDRNVDMKSYKTFAWGPTPSVSLYDNNPLLHSRIKNAIEYYLGKGGMVENTDDPDIYATYYGESDEQFQVNTVSSAGYAYGPGWTWNSEWGGSNVGMTSTTPIVQQAGTLVIDLWDARTQKIVWRGTMTGTIPENPQKATKKVDKGIEKMVRKWQEMHAKDQTAGQ